MHKRLIKWGGVLIMAVSVCNGEPSFVPKLGNLPAVAINYTDTPPLIDGKLNDPSWKEEIEVFPFIASNGEELPTQQTKVWLVYDKENLYIAFECKEFLLDPRLQRTHEIKAEKTQRDSSVWEDDCIEVFINPTPSKSENYYHFVVNTRATTYDAYCPRPQDINKEWKADIAVKTFVGEESWIVEMAIPFKGLGVSAPVSGEEWKINLCREEQPLKEYSCWSPTLGTFHAPEKFGRLIFGKDIPRITLSAIPKVETGSNSLSLKVTSFKPQEIKIKTIVGYEGADQVSSEKTFELKPDKENLLESEYIVSTEAGQRKYSKAVSLFYEVLNPISEQLYYSSSPIAREIEKDIFNTRLMVCTFGAFYHQIKELYLNQDSVQYISVVIQSAVKAQIKECKLVFEVPSFISIVNPIAEGRMAPAPINFVLEKTRRAGMDYNKYVLTYKEERVFPMGELPTGILHNALLLKVSRVEEPSSKEVFAYYYSEADSQKERENRVPIYLLPSLSGKSPKSIPIIEWSSPNSSRILDLSRPEQEEIFRLWRKSGFNVKGLEEFGNEVYQDKHISFFRQLGLELVKGLPLNCESSPFPDAVSYLKDFPVYRAMNGTGKYLGNVICPTHIIKDPSYKMKLKAWLGQIAEEYDFILWDYEVPPATLSSTCFCDKCLEKFKDYASVKDVSFTPQIILKMYKEKWVDFQCYRNSEIAGILNEVIKATNHLATFVVYSGYQGITKEQYGVDWYYMSKYVDKAMCGYGRPLTMIKDTLKALQGKPLVGGELVWVFKGTAYPMEDIKINLFMRLTDCGGGILTYSDFIVDGRFYKAISDISSVVADYEEFFLDFKRDDELVTVEGLPKEDVAVLINKKGERLVFVFNKSFKEKECLITNHKISPLMVAYDYDSKNISPLTSGLKITIPKKDVKTIFVGNKK